MFVYSIRKFPWVLFDLLVILTITFALSYLLPGDPARTIAGPHATAATIAHIREQLGLNQPIPVQYLKYIYQIIHLNFGTSIEYGTPVLSTIWSKFAATSELALAGLVIEFVIGVPIGIWLALKQGGVFDRIASFVSFICVSLPQFWIGMMLLYLFAFKLKWFPLGGDGAPVITHVFLPGLTLGIGGSAYYIQLIKSRVTEVLQKQFIQSAKARGNSQWRIIIRHVVPNITTTLATQISMDLGYFMAGVVVVETVFGWPGIGLQAWTAIEALDVPLILGTVLFGAFWIVIANLVVDFLYGLLDPRIRTS